MSDVSDGVVRSRRSRLRPEAITTARCGWRDAAGGAIVATLVILSVWVPVWRHEFIPVPSISAEAIGRARTHPADVVLRDVGRNALTIGTGVAESERVRVADDLLRGLLALPSQPPTKVSPRFSPTDLDNRPPTLTLQLASLVAVEIYLDAWEQTRDARYLEAARDYVVAFAAYESGTWMNEGFVRNDHAIAARVGVLARFWLHFRGLPEFDASVARSVLMQAARCRSYLADPSHFTAATNHGVMQNVALLQAAIAFPTLPDSEPVVAEAMRRLVLQLAFYLSTEGVVLEHSAGYHAFGLRLIDQAVELARALGQGVPGDWISKRARGEMFLEALKRPDGSLPIYGNTSGEVGGGLPIDPCRAPGVMADLYPVSGYAVWRVCDGPNGGPFVTSAHTTILWSHFPGHGHKLADEASVVLWAQGRPWVTNVGYWPYGARGRKETDGWEGSNAVHLVNEPTTIARETSIAGMAMHPKAAFLDLERRTGAGVMRRQVMLLPPAMWIVVDSAQVPNATSSAAWTIYPGVKFTPGEEVGTWEFRDGSRALDVVLLGNGAAATVLGGSFDPFGGWTVINSTPQRTVALRRTFPADGRPVVGYFAARGDNEVRASASVDRAEDPDHWRVRVRTSDGIMTVTRDARMLSWTSNAGSVSVSILPGPDVRADKAQLLEAFSTATQQYPKYRGVNSYRWRVTLVLLGILIAQELACFGLQRFTRFRLGMVRGLAVAGWVGAGIWLHGWYFP